MGTLSYDIPELKTVGSQPATDIVDALTDIKAEANGSVETANLTDGGVSSIDSGHSRFSYTSDLLYIGPLAHVQVLQQWTLDSDGLVACYISGWPSKSSTFVACNTIQPVGTRAPLGGALANWLVAGVGSNPAFTIPGGAGIASMVSSNGEGGPQVFPVTGGSTLYLSATVSGGQDYIQDFVCIIDYYKDFT